MYGFFLLSVVGLATIVTAAEPPTITIQLNSTFRVYRPETVFTLPCEGSGDPAPVFSWTKNGLPLTIGGRITKSPTQGTLTFNPIKSEDDGYYRCLADNDHGTALSYDVLLKPAYLGNFPQGGTAMKTADLGTYIMLPCATIEATPKSVQRSYSWATQPSVDSTSDEVLEMDNRRAIDDDGNLHILKAETSDTVMGTAIYKCVIYNYALDVRKGGSYHRLQVNPTSVTSSPIMRYSTPDHVVLKGEYLDLSCFISGNPLPSMTWSRGTNEQLPVDRTERRFQHVRIKPVKFEDETTYKCQSGVVTREIRVKVESKPEWDMKPESGVRTYGGTTFFVCRGTAKPPPTVNWYINGKPLVEDSRRYLNGARDNLTISALTKEDRYVVQCNVSNTHGYSFANAFLNVVDVTNITTGPSDETIGDKSQVTFNCAAQVDPATSLVIDWLHNDQPINYEVDRRYKDAGNSLVIIFRNENDGGDSLLGKYTCVAHNGVEPVMASAQLSKTAVAGIFGGGIGSWWWLLLIAALLLILIILLIGCFVYARNRGGGEAYPVDENERKAGHDPEKDLKDSGFQEWAPGMEPFEGGFVNPAAVVPTRPRKGSLTGSLKLGSDDEEGLDEYADIDTGKFNEDGSFIGEYNDDKKDQAKGQILETEA